MAKQKLLPDGSNGLPMEKGFVQTPVMAAENTSLWGNIRGVFAMFKRQEKVFLWTYLSVFLLGLFMAEALNPNLQRNFLLCFILGLSAGVLATIIRENMDDRLGNEHALRAVLPLPLLGVAPAADKKNTRNYALLSAQQPQSRVAEAFRQLRNSILMLTPSDSPRVLNVTSTEASEGKSSTCINLATCFAEAGQKVLLIDADLRRPTLHKHFELDNTRGFGNYLAGLNDLDKVTHASFIPNLSVIPAGPITPHPVELLSGERLHELVSMVEKGETGFELVIIDSPPVMGLADALLLSNRASATMLVVARNQTGEEALQNAHMRLRQAKAKLIGMVMTKGT